MWQLYIGFFQLDYPMNFSNRHCLAIKLNCWTSNSRVVT